MSDVREVERRTLPRAQGEVRATTMAKGKTGLRGTAAVTNSLSLPLGGFQEEIAPGAFDRALKKSDIRGLFNHSANYVLGRTKSGTMRVWADSKGLHYEIPSLPASRADVAEAVQRGDVDGNSFSFVVAKGGDSFSNRNGVTVRRITEFEEILDVGPVVWPAYTSTTIAQRALDTAATFQMRSAALVGERARLAAADQDNRDSLAEHERAERRRLIPKVRERNLRILARLVGDDVEDRWLERVSLHEAAHAVGYWLDGAGVDAVGLDLQDNPVSLRGYARCKDDDLKSLHSVLAGRAAERIAGYPARLFAGDSDIAKARELLPVDRRSDADIELEIIRAQDWLTPRFAAVRALAREIQLKTDLDGDNAEKIIGQALVSAKCA
jgi:uncharacterized protein